MSIQSIQLADLRLPAHDPRSVIDDAALDEFAASIRSDGLLQNLVVALSRGKTYKVISGDRRFAVAFGVGGSRWFFAHDLMVYAATLNGRMISRENRARISPGRFRWLRAPAIPSTVKAAQCQ